MRYFLALILSLLPLAFGQAPYPGVATLTTLPTAIAASISAYFNSVENQPAFTSLAGLMATATGLTHEESAAFDAANDDPISLAYGFATATATPAWYTEIPAPFQSYVNSIASVGASIALEKGSGAERVEAKIAVMGSLLATMLVVMFLL